MKKTLLLYTEFKEIFDALSDTKAGILIKAIFEYERTGKATLDPSLKIIFIPIRQAIDRNKEKYDKVCERNALNIKQRWDKENTKNTTGKSGIPEIPDDTRNTDSDSDKDIDSEIEIEKLKDRKKNYRENIRLTEKENARLIEVHGSDLTNLAYDFLRDYKIEKNYSTRSDYLSITRWVMNAAKEKKQKDGSTHRGNFKAVNGGKSTGAQQLIDSLRDDILNAG